MGFLLRWLVTFAAILLVTYLLPFVSAPVQSAAVFALVLGLLNTFVRPIVFVLTLPFTIVTLGLFSLIVNLAMFWLAAKLVPDFVVSGGWLNLILAAVAVSLCSSILGRLVERG